MRTFDEFEQLIYDGGDLLFSSVLMVTKSRKKALEVLCLAGEKYLECTKRLNTKNQKYRFYAGVCERILKRRLPNNPNADRLTDEEREKILSSAKIHIASNCKPKKSKLIKALIILAIILFVVGVVAYEIHYFYSDEFKQGYADWYKKEEEFQKNHGWGHYYTPHYGMCEFEIK